MTILLQAPDAERPRCRSCGEARTLNEYRFFRLDPEPMYMDFCTWCEQREGTITLYRRYNAYGTKQIIDAVFAAERVPYDRRTDQQVRLLVAAKSLREPESNEEVIHRELARRELARRRLLYFTTTFMPEYKPGWVHQDIARRLEKFVEDVERGLSPRLMIAMPPRHGKTQLASDMLVSWILGKHPEWGIIGASYAQSLPIGFSRNIRDRLRDEEYMAMFPDTKLRTDSQGVEEWKTTKGGGYIAAGVGVGINGKGMHIGIGDDLLKDAEAAGSETIRAATLAWYQKVFSIRLAPGGGILLIGTRWHDADVQGAVLALNVDKRKAGVPENELDNWELVNYPAIADEDEFILSDGQIWRGSLPDDEVDKARLLREKGEALHPERYDFRALMRIKHSMPPADWSALYQQNPTPDDGEFFKRLDMRFRRLSKDYWPLCRIFMTTDYAIKKKQKNDYTVVGVFALDCDDNLFVLDIARGRWGTYEIAKVIVGMIKTYRPEVYAGEQGQIHASVWPVVMKELEKEQLKDRKLSISVDDSLIPVQEKEVRARPLQARTQMHKLHFSYEGTDIPEIYNETVKELLRFPTGTFDDIVDMLAWGARLSLNMSLPTRPVEKKHKSWKDNLGTADASGLSHMAA